MKQAAAKITPFLAALLFFVGLQSSNMRMLGQAPAQPGADQAAVGNAIGPTLIKRVQPAFPSDLESKVGGDVIMNVTIATDGTVQDIKVTHGLPQLIRPALHAVAQWRYRPASVNGVAVPFKTSIRVSFEMASNQFEAEANNAAALAAAKVAPPAPRPVLPPLPEGVVRISGRIMDTMVEKRVDPVYPADPAAPGAQGSVILLATIGKTGEVENVTALSGPLRFRDAATNAVKQWKYRPYAMEGGDPVTVQTTITLNFAPPN